MSNSEKPPGDRKQGDQDVIKQGERKKKKEEASEAEEERAVEVKTEITLEEEDNNEDEEELPLGLLEKEPVVEGKREKRKVERLSMPAPQRPDSTQMAAGKGMKLGDIERVRYFSDRMKAEELKALHRILFNRMGQTYEVKKNIRQFSGFPFSKSDKLFKKKEESLKKYSIRQLKSAFCEALDLERSGTKEEITARILAFLLKPRCSGKPLPNITTKRRRSRPRQGKAGRAKKARKPEQARAGGKSRKAVVSSGEVPSSNDSSDEEEENTDDDNDTEEEEEEEEAEEEEEEEDIMPPKKRAKVEKKSSKKTVKKGRARNVANVSRKMRRANVKKADSSTTRKERRKVKQEAVDSDDEPLICKVRQSASPPSEDELRKEVAHLLKGANLEKVTMKEICRQVYAQFPRFDLTDQKEFIKQTIKELIS
uniref:protein DEK-like n=1 Tax=Myxine glutinosa TaxID=7769 RepID=UPI00358F465D